MSLMRRLLRRLPAPAYARLRAFAEGSLHYFFYPAVRGKIPPSQFKVLVLGVYRFKNAAILAPHIEDAKRHKWKTRLWGLDAVHPSLQACSAGTGKGSKFSLLNRLIQGEDLSAFDWVVVMDDDVRFKRGSMAQFLAIAEAAGMALAQPAHTMGSFVSHGITLCQPLAVARLTTFVEVGPIFAVNRAWVSKLMPFPEDYEMGWGLDVEWSDLRAHGARLGVVDWVTLRHLQPVAKGYDDAPECERLKRSLRARDVQSIADIHKAVAVWRPWQSRCPWMG